MKRIQEMSLEELWHLFPIRLVPPDARWASWYEAEDRLLRDLLRPLSKPEIHHIGSTAVSGIWAKPIVDILIEVSPDEFSTAISLIKEHYVCMNESPARASFNKGYTENGFAERVFHIHLRMTGDRDEICFRDYLRDHPDTAREYESLKLDLWKKWEFNRDGYTQAKTEFVNRITALAKKENLRVSERISPLVPRRTGRTIRQIRPEEVKAAIALAWEVFLQFEAPEYPPEGVETFRRDVVENRSFLDNCQSGVCPLYGAFEGTRMVGMIGMRSSRTHINLLFVKREFHHQGIGRALFNFLIEDQRNGNPSLREVTLNSSPYAIGFYLRLGFEPMAGEQVTSGIRYTPMRYLIR